ncbi:hypothetical protein D5400_17735 [Georhizobium profundi]|uniref:Uncharacterized protein n=1 Tax=Georhizobium profundi TaxID=2341112 RepID=A0A3S9B7L1_9HYPH|nr:hypothetical protein D5400_17735 [Georhizobium profundi]
MDSNRIGSTIKIWFGERTQVRHAIRRTIGDKNRSVLRENGRLVRLVRRLRIFDEGGEIKRRWCQQMIRP